MSSTSLTLLFFVGSVVVSLASGCSSPYQQVGGWCIFVNITGPVIDPDRPKTWFRARELCQESQGDLVSFDDERKLQAVSEHLDLNFREESEQGWVYWVGAHRTNGQWQWVNNKPLNLNSNIWLPGEPSTSATTQQGRLVQVDKVHGRRYLVSNDAALRNSPAHICERQ
ncbi:C-type lectin domain family 6 member A-like isoform X1 [Palaemon carinicauda]|uniref:C-type lectin domain family 6 member A-like isoform X1 n=1 Tax=Palaemon carinicauda TaxID=392227 RepID=UPI0035B6479D